MRYIRVVDGQAIKPDRPLPRNWENITNFYLFDNETLKSYGWFPYRIEYANIPSGWKPNGFHIEVGENEVVEYQDIIEKTEEDIQTDIRNQWSEIRSTRNTFLTDSDWTQLADSPLSELKKEQWRVYRQELRDITLQDDVFNIVWPIKPGTENE